MGSPQQEGENRVVEVVGQESEKMIAQDLIWELIDGYNNNTLRKQPNSDF